MCVRVCDLYIKHITYVFCFYINERNDELKNIYIWTTIKYVQLSLWDYLFIPMKTIFIHILGIWKKKTWRQLKLKTYKTENVYDKYHEMYVASQEFKTILKVRIRQHYRK